MSDSAIHAARARLDAHVREIVRWHFDPATGCPFWLERAKTLDFDPLKDDQRLRRPREVRPVRGRVAARRAGAALGARRRCADKPIYVFETGGTTGIPKTRIASTTSASTTSCSATTLPDEYFPKGSNWLMLGPSRPAPAAAGGRAPRAAPRRHLLLRRSRSALGHQADQEGLDGAPGGLQGARASIRRSRSSAPATTSSACSRRRSCSRRWRCGSRRWARRIRKAGITGIFSGGTEFTPQWNRFAHEELLDGAYMTPTYGNTLMGLAAERADAGRTTTTRSPTTRRSRAPSIEVVDFDDPTTVVEYGADRPREADDADEGILHARLPRARRRRARAAVREVSLGRRQRRAAVPRLRGDDDGWRVLRRLATTSD